MTPGEHAPTGTLRPADSDGLKESLQGLEHYWIQSPGRTGRFAQHGKTLVPSARRSPRPTQSRRIQFPASGRHTGVDSVVAADGPTMLSPRIRKREHRNRASLQRRQDRQQVDLSQNSKSISCCHSAMIGGVSSVLSRLTCSQVELLSRTTWIGLF